MERDLNFTVTDDRRDDSVRVNGGISEYAEVRSRAAELFRRPGIRVTAALLCCLLTDSDFRRKLGSAARETVFCGFSSAGFAERVLRAYRSLLSDAGKELVNAA